MGNFPSFAGVGEFYLLLLFLVWIRFWTLSPEACKVMQNQAPGHTLSFVVL